MYIRGNGKTMKETGEEYSSGKMAPSMRDIGRTTSLLATGDSYTQTAMSTSESGLMTELPARVHLFL